MLDLRRSLTVCLLLAGWTIGTDARAADVSPERTSAERAGAQHTPRNLRWQRLAQQTPAELYPGEVVDVPLTIRNPGPVTWSHAAGDRLSYHWYDSSGALVEYEGLRTPLGNRLAQSQQRELLATLRAPATPGTYYLQWAMVREHAGWYLPPQGCDAECLTIPVEVRPGASGWSLLSASLDGPVRVNEPSTARVRLRNATSTTWDADRGDRLSYHWRDENGTVVEEGVRTLFSNKVPPGQTVELAATVRGPQTPGKYVLAWEPVREHKRWYGPPTPNPANWHVVEVSPSPRHWQLLAAELPDALTADEIVDVPLRLRNTGGEPWTTERGDSISYRWVAADGNSREGIRTPLPDALNPGVSTTIHASLRAPAAPGTYQLTWAIVREHVAWYTPDATVPTNVEIGPHRLAAEIVEVDWPLWMAVNGETDVEVTVRNTGQETWSEDQGDRLAYHWLTRDGLPVVFDGHRTHLPHAVEPGQSITLPARVVGPARAGKFDLTFDMVREHVAWYADVARDQVYPQRSSVSIIWQSGLLQLIFLCLTILALAIVRRKHPQSLRGRAALELTPVVWAGAAGLLLVSSFAELSSYALWRGSAWLAGSSAGLAALAVVLVPARARPWMACVWGVIGSILILADLIYMHFCGSIVPLQAIWGAHQVGDISTSIGATLGGTHIWLLPVPLAGLVLALGLPRQTFEPEQRTTRRRVWAIGLGFSLIWAAPFGLRMVEIMGSELGYRVYSEQRNVGRLGVLGAHVFDALRTLRERTGRGQASEQEIADLRRWFEARRQVWQPPEELPAGEKSGVAEGSNVLIIQVESMQGWVVGAEVDGQEITPFLNRMRSQARYFPHYADLTAQGMTSDSEYATLNSNLPLAQGALAFLRSDNAFYTLAHVLEQRGYTTFSAHPYKRGFWNRALLHPRYGFGESWFRRELGEGLVVGWGLADGLFFDRVVPKLAELDAGEQPFFSFLVTLSVHHPYDSFPPSLIELELGELEGTALGNYIHGMHYTDASLAALFEQLTREGILDHTIVAVYGDHDSRLGHDPDLLTLAGIDRWSPAVTPMLERVPAFLWIPSDGEPVRGAVDTVGGHIDLAPTILHYLGVPAPMHFLGRPLLPGARDGIAVFADGSARGDGLFWLASGPGVPQQGMCIRDPDGTPTPPSACHNLATRAADMLHYSRRILDHDLARTISAE